MCGDASKATQDWIRKAWHRSVSEGVWVLDPRSNPNVTKGDPSLLIRVQGFVLGILPQLSRNSIRVTVSPG